MASKETLRICSKGHKFYKSSNCPTCPICENERKTNNKLLDLLSAPARKGFEREGITSLTKLAKYSEKDILKLHGMGPSSLPILKKLLKSQNLNFKKV